MGVRFFHQGCLDGLWEGYLLRPLLHPRGDAEGADLRSEVRPNGAWVEQQARNLVYDLAERGEKASYLIRDGDTKFTQKFDEIFKSEGIKVKKQPYRSPSLNAFAERFVQSIKQECLDHFVVFGEHHLERLIREYERHYNTVRPHQGLGNATILPYRLQPRCRSIPARSSATHDQAGLVVGSLITAPIGVKQRR